MGLKLPLINLQFKDLNKLDEFLHMGVSFRW